MAHIAKLTAFRRAQVQSGYAIRFGRHSSMALGQVRPNYAMNSIEWAEPWKTRIQSATETISYLPHLYNILLGSGIFDT